MSKSPSWWWSELHSSFVAIFVHAVSVLECSRVDRALGVVAIAHQLGKPVAIVVGVVGVFVHFIVAVVVQVIHQFGRSGVDAVVGVIAVAIDFGKAIAVPVVFVSRDDVEVGHGVRSGLTKGIGGGGGDGYQSCIQHDDAAHHTVLVGFIRAGGTLGVADH